MMNRVGLVLAVLFAGGAASAAPVLQTASSSVSYNGGTANSVQATASGSNSSNSNSANRSFGAVTVGGFNGAVGLLNRVTVSAASGTSIGVGATVSSATGGGNVGAGNVKTATASASAANGTLLNSNGNVGLTLATSPATVSASCSVQSGSCSTGQASTTVGFSGSRTYTSNADVLAFLNQNQDFTPRFNLTADISRSGFNAATGVADLTLNPGSLNVAYGYYAFAAPEFGNGNTSITRNAGTLRKGIDGPVTLGFRLANGAAADAAGAEISNVVIGASLQGLVTTTASSFRGVIAAADSRGFSLTFNPLQLGVFNDILTFTLTDQSGLGVNPRSTDLTLRLLANVVVPAPATGAALAAGLGALALLRRRRGA
jgi:hypothetical protein